MAEVYKVKTVGIAGFEKVQALKRIRPHYARKPRFIRSFVDEARIAVELSHRNIVQVFDFGKAGGDLYLAMELIDGIDLRTAVGDASKRGIALPILLSCYILGEIGAGLEYAHRKTDLNGESLGIVHCDVSPPNVMLAYDGYVKILDFGVARARFTAQQHSRQLRGKPRYMAPEQTRGEPPTPATDVFALGIVAWELLTGRPLFDGRDLQSVLAAVRRVDAPPVDQINPQVPPVVATTVAQALAPKPEKRGNSGDFAAVMQHVAQHATPRANAYSLSEWLHRVYPERECDDGALAASHDPDSTAEPTNNSAIESTAASAIEPTAADGGAIVERPSSEITTQQCKSRVQPWDSAETTAERPLFARMPTESTRTITRTMLELVDSIDEPDPPGLREKRRVVATAIEVEGGSDGAHYELIQLLGDLAYKRGAVIHSEALTSLVALFGLEVAGEDDVANAMSYALVAVEVAREVKAASDPDLTLRFAARAGIVAAPDDCGGYRLVGDAVEETRALARRAEPGRPLLSGGAGRLTSMYYAFRELPGRHHPRRQRLLELIGPRSFDERTRALRTRKGHFFGRTNELDQLSRALERTVAESRQVVVATIGPPGVGKSRLIAEFVARATEEAEPQHRPALIAAAATPGGQLAPFGLLIDLLQALLNLPPGSGEAARSRLAQRTRHILQAQGIKAGDIDEVVGAIELGMELRDGAPLSPAHASTDLRERITSAVHTLRNVLAHKAGRVIVVVEDLHFADASSVEILRRCAAIADARPELVILTGSSDDKTIKELAEWVDQMIEIGGLPAAEVRQLVRDQLGNSATDRAVSTIAARAGGNPLLVEQLVVAARDAGQIPPTARAMIVARVDRLSPAAKAVLQHAAVAGLRFRPHLLEALFDRDIDDAFDELCEDGLLERSDGSAAGSHEGGFAFAGGIIREVVYESISARARRDTHGRFGELLAARFRAGRDEPPATIAEHFEQGGRDSAASAFWLRAGRVALAAGDDAAAGERFSRTLAIEDKRDEETRSPASRARIREALAGREHAYRKLGNHDAAARDLERLERIAEGDPQMLADIKNRCATRFLRLGDYQAAVAASEHAEAAARACDDERSRGEALRIRGEAYERLGGFERSLDITRRAQAIFQRINAPLEETNAMIGIGRTYVVLNRYEEARTHYDEIIARVRESGDTWLERVVRNHVAVIHFCLGEFEEAMNSIEHAIAICRRFGDHAREGDCLSVAGTILMHLGCYAEAAHYFTDALSILERTNSWWSRADCLVYAGRNAAYLGDYNRGLAHLNESLAESQRIGAPYVESNAFLALAGTLLAHGDSTAARAAAQNAVSIARAATLTGFEIHGLSRQAVATWQSGDLDSALVLSSRAMEMLDRQIYIEGSEEELLYSHYRLLEASGNDSARATLARAKETVRRKLDRLQHSHWRHTFTHVVPVNVAILAAAPGSHEDRQTTEVDHET
ncbi:MAG: protein kinase [Proteobacteria bacterium]|nr:protein kinase [Pseudomonadota bacterium]